MGAGDEEDSGDRKYSPGIWRSRSMNEDLFPENSVFPNFHLSEKRMITLFKREQVIHKETISSSFNRHSNFPKL